MAKNLRKALLFVATAVSVLCMLFAIVFMAACGGNPETPDAQEYTLTFVTGGGTAIEPIKAKAGESITPPADPTWEGHGFEGWYLTADCDGDVQTIPTVMPAEDITYYAKWTAYSVLTLDLDGGKLDLDGVTYEDKAELTMEVDTDIYAYVMQTIPEKTGYQFGAWFNGEEELAEGTKLPAGGLTLTAKWKAPVAIKLFKLDFVTYTEYVEDEAAATTIYAYEGTVISGETYVPAHYYLNSKNEPVTVAGLDTVLNVYVDPNYVVYSDVFESTDFIYQLETDAEHLYLDRIELGRKVSTSFNADTGVFAFGTDGAFVLEGKLAADGYFYYFRDTIEKTFTAFDGSAATLEIKSVNEVVYTDAAGKSTTGSYDIDIETGRYQFLSATLNFEFLLYTDGLDLLFRTHDGLDGFYAYGDDDLVGGGWVLLGFDGFGTVTYVEDSGYIAYYNYVYLGNYTVAITDLGTLMLVDKKMGDLGGYAVKGEFHLADAYLGEYTYTKGYRLETLILDGFGGFTYTLSIDGGDAEVLGTGTYAMQFDESWYVRTYSEYLGGYVKSYYSNVTSWLEIVYATGDKAGSTEKFLLSEVANEYGTTVGSNFEPYDPDSYNYAVKPGRYALTTSFVFKGTNYVVDDDHDAFLYFLPANYDNGSYQAVQLWYGTKDAAGDFVYEYFIYAAWYAYGNEIYIPGGYDGLYLNDNGDGTYSYNREEYDGEVKLYVFPVNEGALTIDEAGVARYTPADGEAYTVSYKTVATGLITILEFSGLPAGVHTTFAIYTDAYRYNSEYETFIYDITDSVYYIAYADGVGGGDLILVVTADYVFLGVAASDYYGNEFIEFIFAGKVDALSDSDDEFTFVWDDDIWYDAMEYYDNIDDIIEMYGAFQFKLVGNEFFYYDGIVLDLTSGADKFVTDGYGSATFTQNGVAKKGIYYLEYTLIVFIDENEEETVLKPDSLENPTSFKIVHPDFAMEFGTYYETTLYDGVPSSFMSDILFFDGDGNVLYGDITFSEDYFSYTYVELYGTYELIGYSVKYTNAEKGVTLAQEYKLTFAEDDVRTVLIMIYELDGYYFGFFTVKSEIYLGEYEAVTDDGASLGTLKGGDGYSTYEAEFYGEDAEGEFYYLGYMARGFIHAEYYNAQAQFVEDIAGDVVVFVSVDEDGYADRQFVFDIKANGTVVYRNMFYGTVAEYSVKEGYSGNYMRLDGHGGAELYNGNDVRIAAGEYMFAPELGADVYLFVAGTQRFTFKPQFSATDAATMYTYTKYTAADDGIYINDDWSVLWLDGFGRAVYIDVYGTVTYGSYYEVIAGEKVYCIKVDYSAKRLYLELTAEGGFAMCEGDFLIRGNVLYAYFGSDAEIRIPDSVSEIAAQAFMLTGASNITKIDFNNVTKIADDAFYLSTSLVELSSEKITEIGANAFEGLWSLERVYLPNLVTLGARAFYGCLYLGEVVLGKIESIGANAFSRSIAFDDIAPLVLDLTASENPAAIKIDLTAFQAVRGWMGFVDDLMLLEGSKILISGGVDALNAVLASPSLKGTLHLTVQRPTTTEEVDWTVDLTPYVELASVEDPVAGVTYYSLIDDVIFTFEKGTLVKYAYDGYYSYNQTLLGSYYVEDGTVYLYSLHGTQYAVDSSFAVGGDSITVDGVEACVTGKLVEVTFTATNGKELVFGYTATVSFSYSVSLSIYAETVTYDGMKGSNVDFMKSSGLLKFNANSHSYSATLKNGEWTVVDNGVEVELFDKTNDAIWFKAVLTVKDDGSAELKGLQCNTYGASYPDSFTNVYDYNKVEGKNAWMFSVNNVSYTLEYFPAADGADAYILVTNNGYSMKDSSWKYTITLKIDESNDTIIEIISLADYYGTTVYEITNITYSEDRKSATVDTTDGSFVIKLERYYESYSITVSRGNYSVTETMKDSGYNYEITLTYSVDADGNAKIVKIIEFAEYSYSGNTPIVIMSEITYHEDGSASFETANGSYVLKMGTSYGSLTIFVTKTNYEYSVELYESGYNYKVTVTIKVDAEGNKKIIGFEKLYDWDAINDYLEVDSWNVSDDGVLTVHVSDSRHTKGRTATITLIVGSYSDSVSLVWSD